MQEMIYCAGRKTIQRIAEGNYEGLDYYVLSLGSHPCAYVDVSNTPYGGMFYENIDIQCHGGLTYSRSNLSTVNKEGWFIGWDYAHCGDFMCYETVTYPGKQWTAEEIVEECKSVIRQLIEGMKKEANHEKDIT